MDSIIKNVRKAGNYAETFSNNLVKVFLHVFERVNVYPTFFRKKEHLFNFDFPRWDFWRLQFEQSFGTCVRLKY